MAETKPAAKPRKKAAATDTPKRARLSRLRPRVPKFLRPITGYFSGAWYELRQVRWPNRQATWSLTFAVLVYSAFFFVLILGLDTLFNYLFKEVLL